MVHVPMTGGAIVPAYNYPGCEAKMTQTQLADVFLGKITNWSEFGCADKNIVTVCRSDGSGTTKGFTNSLSAFSPEWKKNVGTGKAVAWPVGVGGKGNSGVAATIKNQPGAIGYLNYGYVVNSDFQQVALQNKAGNYVKASAETSAQVYHRLSWTINFVVLTLTLLVPMRTLLSPLLGSLPIQSPLLPSRKPFVIC